MIFYKAVPKKDLKENYIPGTVTNQFEEAFTWFNRYNSTKKNIKGAGKHIQRSEAVIIKFEYDDNKLLCHDEFQRQGVKEHDRESCWTSAGKQKAQINEPINNYKVLDVNDFWKYM